MSATEDRAGYENLKSLATLSGITQIHGGYLNTKIWASMLRQAGISAEKEGFGGALRPVSMEG